jgi:hypothetical protein
VFTSDGISKSVEITLGDETDEPVTVEVDFAYLHLKIEGDTLKLYVPSDASRQRVCLSRQLPIKLLKYLGVENPTAGADLGSIITAPNLFVVDELLSDAGIIDVEGIQRPEDEVVVEEEGATAALVPVGVGERPASSDSTGYSIRTPSPERETHDHQYLTPTAAVSPQSSEYRERPSLWKELLDTVVQQAREIAAVPEIGETITTHSLFSFLPQGSVSIAVSSDTREERDCQIGAAGELFVS